MAKLNPSPIQKRDIAEYLETCDDFQFEMDVFRLSLAKDRFAQHGGTYQDPVTSKDRQFDIRMRITKRLQTLALAVECKNLKSHFPLLVSRVPRRREEAYIQTIVFNGSFSSVGQQKGGACYYQSDEPVGKSTAQIGRTPQGDLTSSDADVYEKWNQAISSSFELISTEANRTGTGPKELSVTIIIPVLVVSNGSLWVVDYNKKGEVIDGPRQANEATMFLGKLYSGQMISTEGGYRISHLHIFTKDGFDNFLTRMLGEDEWEELFSSHP